MKQRLSPKEIENFRWQLAEMLEEHLESTEKIEAEVLEPSGDPDGQTEDEGIEEGAFERDYEAIAAEDRLTAMVRDALRRIEEGTFGLCEDCERPIERERLDELPYTSLCLQCARRRETEQSAR